MIKNILFDMGNVLIRFEPKRYVKNAGLSASISAARSKSSSATGTGRSCPSRV